MQRFDTLLARTDPFDLAQAIEAHVHSLSQSQLRGLIREARPRMSAYYRAELERILGESGLQRQQAGLTAFLKSNLRVIPLFRKSFAAAILKRVPSERAVAIGEEAPNRTFRGAIFAAGALALIVAGAAGERIVANARMAAQTPAPFAYAAQPVVMPSLSPSPPGTPLPATAKPATPKPATPKPATPAPQTPAPTAPPTAAPSVPPPAAAEPVPTPPRHTRPTPAPSRGQGIAVVTVPPPTPTPEPSDLDVNDMPESYTDATPLPEQSAGTATVAQHGIHVVTPKPSPRPRSWLHRSIMHLDPFKPHPEPT